MPLLARFGWSSGQGLEIVLVEALMATYNDPVTGALREHLGVCDALLLLAQREAEVLRQPGPFAAARFQAERKDLLVRLESSSRSVADQRERWCQLNGPGGETPPELADLVRTTLDTIMRALVISRENEEALLRRGLLPPRSLPRAEQSQPSFVARTYQRHTEG
jgi:hypothetical protein